MYQYLDSEKSFIRAPDQEHEAYNHAQLVCGDLLSGTTAPILRERDRPMGNDSHGCLQMRSRFQTSKKAVIESGASHQYSWTEPSAYGNTATIPTIALGVCSGDTDESTAE